MFFLWLKNSVNQRIAVSLVRRSMFSTDQKLTSEIIRRRLESHLDKKPTFLEGLEKEIPRIKRLRRASILLPLFHDEVNDRVEVLLIKRSEKLRSHTGMIAFPGGMTDPTDRDSIHTAQREAFEETGIQEDRYSVVGPFLPLVDSRLVVITPIVAILKSPKFVDFQLCPDEAADAFYVDLEQFLYKSSNYSSRDFGDDFITHHFQVNQHHIWGVTAYELVLLAAIVFQRSPNFPVYRHNIYLDLNRLSEQQINMFRISVDYDNYLKKKQLDQKTSRL